MTDQDILAAILRNEGGYSDHRHDGGGATNFGVTAVTLGAWRHLGRQATRAEVKALTPAEAEAIYTARYLQPFAAIPNPELRHYLIDLGVLRGPSAAAMMLQEIVGAEQDGVIGPKTIAAIAPLAQHVLVMLIGARFAHIEQRVRDVPSQQAFRAGWRSRNASFLPT